MRKKKMPLPGREPTIYGLLDYRANHYATESAASWENYKLYKTSRKKKKISAVSVLSILQHTNM